MARFLHPLKGEKGNKGAEMAQQTTQNFQPRRSAMAEQTDWVKKNKTWSIRWGHIIDPKSVKIVKEPKRSIEERELAMLALPIGFGAHAIVREELQREIGFFGRLRKAIETNTLEALDAELDQEEQDRIHPKKKDASKIAQQLKDDKEVEDMVLSSLDGLEENVIEECKHCNQPRWIEGQGSNIHRCGITY